MGCQGTLCRRSAAIGLTHRNPKRRRGNEDDAPVIAVENPRRRGATRGMETDQVDVEYLQESRPIPVPPPAIRAISPEKS